MQLDVGEHRTSFSSTMRTGRSGHLLHHLSRGRPLHVFDKQQLVLSIQFGLMSSQLVRIMVDVMGEMLAGRAFSDLVDESTGRHCSTRLLAERG